MWKRERIKRVNEIDYLVISSTIDFSTDLVCCRLVNSHKKFYRLNRDELSNHVIEINMQNKSMKISIDNEVYLAKFEELKGVYFRAPVFLRAQSKKPMTIQEQLERNQWSSFLRNLIVFRKAVWINNPVNTYQAENKMYQLCLAKECGLNIPETHVTNNSNINIIDENNYIVKSLDTAIFYDVENNNEMFTYANVVTGTEIKEYDLRLAPLFIQEFLEPKIDCRCTYVNGNFFSVRIEKENKGVYGDWRIHKEQLDYIPFALPKDVEKSIKELMGCLGLNFGGIDLAYVNNHYYFIEVNPTGEWGWLEVKAGLDISTAIINAMQGDNEYA